MRINTVLFEIIVLFYYPLLTKTENNYLFQIIHCVVLLYQLEYNIYTIKAIINIIIYAEKPTYYQKVSAFDHIILVYEHMTSDYDDTILPFDQTMSNF